MIILIKSFLNSKLDLIRIVKFVKQLFRTQIKKGGKLLLWNQVKSLLFRTGFKCQIDTFFSLLLFYSQKIWVNGCMTEARQTLFKHVMPLLLICALVSLVVGLIELLLLLCAVCFADHIKVRYLCFHSK